MWIMKQQVLQYRKIKSDPQIEAQVNPGVQNTLTLCECLQ